MQGQKPGPKPKPRMTAGKRIQVVLICFSAVIRGDSCVCSPGRYFPTGIAWERAGALPPFVSLAPVMSLVIWAIGL